MNYSKSTLNNGADPQDIADAIARISRLRRPKLRYAMGKGVHFLLFSKVLLPWNWLESFVLKFMKKEKLLLGAYRVEIQKNDFELIEVILHDNLIYRYCFSHGYVRKSEYPIDHLKVGNQMDVNC